MKAEEYEKLAKGLQERGYKKYSSPNNADYAWFKSFGKSKKDEGRSNYQIRFDVYSYNKYLHLEKEIRETFGVEPIIMVSRHIYERIDLTLGSSRVEEMGIEKIEAIAESLLAWVENNDKLFNYESKN